MMAKINRGKRHLAARRYSGMKYCAQKNGAQPGCESGAREYGVKGQSTTILELYLAPDDYSNASSVTCQPSNLLRRR